ncbi:MAG: YkgJ family cysteine cluster protein [Nitrospirae bacterium]|nr:YkgJ family cysteine cluster protein [Nitrospirota bacterium]
MIPDSVSAGREKVGDAGFRFSCGPELKCYNRCCHNPDLELYPYDIVRLCRKLGMKSSDFLKRHTRNSMRTNPWFPSVMLVMANEQGRPCPFLSPDGCGVYEDRPDACRMFPLERGMSVHPFKKDSVEEVYFLQRMPWCFGHSTAHVQSIPEWIEAQGLAEYNRMGEIWAGMNVLFRRNPWGPDGQESKNFRMAFMACYDVDRFRDFVFGSTFLSRYRLDDALIGRIRADNAALLEFAFDWLKYFLFAAQPENFKAG